MSTPDPSRNQPDHTIVLQGPIRAPSDADSAHYLLVVEGEQTGRRIEIGERPIAIGRSEPCEMVLPDNEMSRKHCSVAILQGSVLVSDNRSTNGTFVQGRRIEDVTLLAPGDLVQIGHHVLRYERRNRREVEAAEALADEVANARRYVEAILPAPIAEGPITANWVYLPSTQLGGDAFGYRRLENGGFECYLIDVSGHGAGSAMHAVAVLNVIARHALPHTDFSSPADVLTRLNTMFPSEAGAGMFFTAWYGCYDPQDRQLRYASAGHHPAFLWAAGEREPIALRTPGLPVGIADDAHYVNGVASVPPDATLYLFSDGVFETRGIDGSEGRLAGFISLMTDGRGPAASEPKRLLEAVTRTTRPGGIDDDFTLLTFGLR